MEDRQPAPSALELLDIAWSWRELDAARCRQAMAAAGGPGSGEFEAARMVVQGYLCFREAQEAEALDLAGKALALLSGHTHSHWYSRALNVRSCGLLELGEFEQATLSLREQLRVSRSNGDTEIEGSALHDLGVMHTRRDPDHADGYLQAAAEIFDRLDHPVGRTFAAWSLGELRERQGDLAGATLLYRSALTLARACGHLFMEVLVMSHLGELELHHGDPVAGERWLREALARQANGPSRPLWITVPPLVRLLLHTGRLPEAREVLEDQLARAVAAGMMGVQTSVHELLSEVLEAMDEPALALIHAREHLRLFTQENAQEQARKVRGLEVLHRTELAEQEVQIQRQRNLELQAALAEQERLHRQLQQFSVTDELTGVRNRHYLMTQGVMLLQAQVGRQPPPAHIAVAILDIDHFKAVNDTYGHDGGDRVLRAFAQFLEGGLREQDVLTRFGGEEFVVLFPETPLGEAHGRLDQLRLGLRQHRFEGLPPDLAVSFTAGIVNCPDGDLINALRRADQLLYRGKRSGRDAVTREWLKAPAGTPSSTG